MCPWCLSLFLGGYEKPTSRPLPKVYRVITKQEVALHTTPASLWIIMWGKVYDFTGLQSHHPGGHEVIQKYGGKDATFTFYNYHSRIPFDSPTLEKYCIGILKNTNSLKRFGMMVGIGEPKVINDGAKRFVKTSEEQFKSDKVKGQAKKPNTVVEPVKGKQPGAN